jgi:hypothetical protein
MNKIMIEVQGGVVVEVKATEELEVYLIDYDNQGDPDTLRRANEPYVLDDIMDQANFAAALKVALTAMG